MKRFIVYLLPLFLCPSCGSEIKNETAEVLVEKGTETSSTDSTFEVSEVLEEEVGEPNPMESIKSENPFIGFWVGYFRKDDGEMGNSYEKDVFVDDGFYWERENKINISIEKIEGEKVTGRSIVAGNDRPFEGTLKKLEGGGAKFEVVEPGDDYYDGEFSFKIMDGELIGTWEAYKNIEIKNRKYTLEKMDYKYDPDIDLTYSKTYVNWNESIESKEIYEYEEGEFEEWVTTEFATATQAIYEINASNRLLKKHEVENMKKGDLTIIRNAIYARHGYSFKNRPLRVFFDAQPWYIPVYVNIKNDFTEIEKNNIELLLKYEKNAEEYYDSFGRG